MEGNKQVGSFSSSSFTSDLFGSKDPQTTSSSSGGIFASIFPSPATVLGKNSGSAGNGSWQNQLSGNQDWNSKKRASASKSGGGVSSNTPIKNRSSTFQDERVEPCHLSSSLYYGGQDIYSHSSKSQSSESRSILKKNGEQDNPNGTNSEAHRGDWWQGSLYY